MYALIEADRHTLKIKYDFPDLVFMQVPVGPNWGIPHTYRGKMYRMRMRVFRASIYDNIERSCREEMKNQQKILDDYFKEKEKDPFEGYYES